MTSSLPLFDRAAAHAERVAIVDAAVAHKYGELQDRSARIASQLLTGPGDLAEQRIAFLVSPGFDYVATQWGIWRAGGIAVPLGLSHPTPELEYVLDDTQAAAVVVQPALVDRVADAAQSRSVRLLEVGDAMAGELRELPWLTAARRAMILYTSGTTGKPKGAVSTHANIQAQVTALVEAWQWTAEDRILHVLPLHHVHGIINALTCALWAGATCEMMPRFDAEEVWQRLAGGDITLFMAVPTIYAKLIAAWDQAPPSRQEQWSRGCGSLRLMVSGSAALPVTTLEKWQSITGHVLLERYGMTEIGMALSNPLRGERAPGHVGTPLPGVEVRRIDEQGRPADDETPAELEVRGPAVFLEYWNNPAATREAFRDGWFRTCDVTVVEDGKYRILGRNSVDILKTGGYKVSALEIEEVLRDHPDIRECAVVGVPDDEWGQRVAACIVPGDAAHLTLDALRSWTRERLAPYKAPSLMMVVDALPRNVMGKVQKPAIAEMFIDRLRVEC
jgi:malonyl-CoA/methylmalonyl-CoA synthetase